ncbi:hypothetical protein ACQEVS_00610 [Streptomyces sp. CA-181903]|uniref:hypothetical protein n=1 Tax=Streptomyces sp. CA-181903 TaxID=3240055 RepID=UPI003D93176C
MTLGQGAAAKPSGRRRVEIDWDHGVKLPAVEIRPGIAVSADVGVTARRLKDVTGETVQQEHPVLSEDEFVTEIDHLLSLIESVHLGKRLVAFFGACRPLPSANGTLEGVYSAQPVLGINPRVLTARSVSGPVQPVTVNLVILQNQAFDDCGHALGEQALTGYGAFTTVVFCPRSGLLIDDMCVAPEIGLAHEMVHAVHYLSGSSHMSDHAVGKGPVTSPEALANDLLLAQTGTTVANLEKWRAPGNQSEWNKLSAAVKKQIEDARAEYPGLLDLARRILQPVMPAGSEPGEVFFQQPVVSLEETKTTGSDVTALWVRGVRKEEDKFRRLGTSRAEITSDEVAAADIKRVEEYGRKNPSNKAVPEALKRAKEIRQLRLQARNLSEAALSRAMHLPHRASYAPTRAKPGPGRVVFLMHRPFYLTKRRKDIPKQAFEDKAPFSRLVAALPADSTAPGEPTPVADIREYVAELQEWDAGAPAATRGSGWRPGDHPVRDCATRKPLTTVSVDPATVPQPVRDQALAVARDALGNPDTPPSTLENERLRPVAPVPLAPAR